MVRWRIRLISRPVWKYGWTFRMILSYQHSGRRTAIHVEVLVRHIVHRILGTILSTCLCKAFYECKCSGTKIIFLHKYYTKPYQFTHLEVTPQLLCCMIYTVSQYDERKSTVAKAAYRMLMKLTPEVQLSPNLAHCSFAVASGVGEGVGQTEVLLVGSEVEEHWKVRRRPDNFAEGPFVDVVGVTVGSLLFQHHISWRLLPKKLDHFKIFCLQKWSSFPVWCHDHGDVHAWWLLFIVESHWNLDDIFKHLVFNFPRKKWKKFL